MGIITAVGVVAAVVSVTILPVLTHGNSQSHSQPTSATLIPKSSDKSVLATLPDATTTERVKQASEVHLVSSNSSNIVTNMSVQLVGSQKEFSPKAVANPGDEVAFEIWFQNAGAITGTEPLINVTLDPNLEYVPGSSIFYSKENNVNVKYSVADKKVKIQRQNLTYAWFSMQPSGNNGVYLLFKARVKPAQGFIYGETVLHNKAVCSFGSADARTDIVKTNDVPITVTKRNGDYLQFSLRQEVFNASLNGGTWSRGPAVAAPGDTVSYRLTAMNTGNTAGKNIRVKVLLPPEIHFAGNVRLYTGSSPTAKPISVQGEALANEGYIIPSFVNGTDNMITIIFDAKALTANAGTISIASTQILQAAKLYAQDEASLLITSNRNLILNVQAQDVSDAKDPANVNSALPGQTLLYRLFVMNNTKFTLPKPVVKVILPAQVTYVDGSCAQDGEPLLRAGISPLFSGGLQVADMSPGYHMILSFKVKVNYVPTTAKETLEMQASVTVPGINPVTTSQSLPLCQN